jgi:hypothetical protein
MTSGPANLPAYEVGWFINQEPNSYFPKEATVLTKTIVILCLMLTLMLPVAEAQDLSYLMRTTQSGTTIIRGPDFNYFFSSIQSFRGWRKARFVIPEEIRELKTRQKEYIFQFGTWDIGDIMKLYASELTWLGIMETYKACSYVEFKPLQFVDFTSDWRSQ